MLTGTDGTNVALAASGGTASVSPKTTATYTATATGPGGTTTATATVTVTTIAAPLLTLTANPTSIASGSASLLTVVASNATLVTLTGTDGTNVTLAAIGGTTSVSPTATATYTATASGPGGTISTTATVVVTTSTAPVVTITAYPTTIALGSSSLLTVVATNATLVNLTGTDGTNVALAAIGGTASVSPTATATYTATASGAGGDASQTAVVTVVPAGGTQSINHVVFMMQENHTFDNYLGMLNPYRKTMGWNKGDDGLEYDVDGIDDKLTTIKNEDDANTFYPLFKLASTCVDDLSSDWLASFGDVNRYNFSSTRPILMDGFVHDAEGYANSCKNSGSCAGNFDDLVGRRAMGYYDEKMLNYYYYMASQFAVSDRWFSPVATKSVGNRIATFTGGTTQGLVHDPGSDDGLTSQLVIPTIFEKLDDAKVTWKIYYTVRSGLCLTDADCPGTSSSEYPATYFSSLNYSYKYLYNNPSHAACLAPTQASSAVGDASDSFCIDTDHIAPIGTYFTDLTSGNLPSFSFIEAGYGNNDEHPGSGQSILLGQTQVASVINALMVSSAWKDSVFFFSYDEGGGPYDHVPPVAGHSNDFTDASLGTIPDIGGILVNPDGYGPCVPVGGIPTTHCDLSLLDPGANPADAAAIEGFRAQLGFRLPNTIISPFARKHFVSHTPMDHTAIIKFVQDRFIGNSIYLTPHEAAQPNLLEFFDFNATPWATPPTPPIPVSAGSLGYDPCTPTTMGP
jgi:phospholipase C